MANEPEKFVIFVIFILAIEFDWSEAEIHKVGGITGWTNIGQVNYKTWASTKNFTVGDVIVFQYNKRFHNVVKVSHQDFNACNSDDAYETFTSGNDSFIVKSSGHFYFICSVSNHCEGGQRVDIRVPAKDATGAQSPATRCIADPPTSARPPLRSHPPKESHPPSTTTHLPPPQPARPPATSQTTSDSTSSVYSFKYCMVVFLLVSCFLFGN